MSLKSINSILDQFQGEDHIYEFDIEDGFRASKVDKASEDKKSDKIKIPKRIDLNLICTGKEFDSLFDEFLKLYREFTCEKNIYTKVKLNGTLQARFQERYKDVLSVFLANAYTAFDNNYKRVYMGNDYIYKQENNIYNPNLVKLDILKKILTFFALNDYIDLYYNNSRKAFETRFKSNYKLKELFNSHNFGINNIANNKKRNFVILKTSILLNNKKRKRVIAYATTSETNRRNNILRKYADLLEDCHQRINFFKPMPLKIVALCIYNKELGRGGRIYAPWQGSNNITSEDRKKFIIDNEPVVEVDLKCCSLRIAMHSLGFDTNKLDLYDIEDNSFKRGDIKLIIQYLLNSKNTSDSLPSVIANSMQSDDLNSNLSDDTKKFRTNLITKVYDYFNTKEMKR